MAQTEQAVRREASSEPAAAAVSAAALPAAPPPPLPFEGHRRRLPPADKLFADGDYEREAQAAQHWEVQSSTGSSMSVACLPLMLTVRVISTAVTLPCLTGPQMFHGSIT